MNISLKRITTDFRFVKVIMFPHETIKEGYEEREWTRIIKLYQ